MASTISETAIKYENGEVGINQIGIIAGKELISKVDVIGVASSTLDLGASVIGIDSNISGFNDHLINAALDPVYLENNGAKATKKHEEDGTIACVLDGESCGMNTVEHWIYVIGSTF